MLSSAAFFFGLLVGTTLATYPLGCYNAATDSIMKTYDRVAHMVQLPNIEYNDKWVAKFAESDIAAVDNYGLYLLNDVECQARAAGEQLIHDLNRACEKLDQSIEEIKLNREANRCDEYVNAVTNQMTIFLNLQPGNGTIEAPVFPDLPRRPVKMISQTKKRSLDELFMSLAYRLNEDASVVDALRSNLLLSGWRAGRELYHDFSLRLRREVLDSSVLIAYKSAADKLLKKSDFIEKYVKFESWKSLRNAIDRVICIFNDYYLVK